MDGIVKHDYDSVNVSYTYTHRLWLWFIAIFRSIIFAAWKTTVFKRRRPFLYDFSTEWPLVNTPEILVSLVSVNLCVYQFSVAHPIGLRFPSFFVINDHNAFGTIFWSFFRASDVLLLLDIQRSLDISRFQTIVWGLVCPFVAFFRFSSPFWQLFQIIGGCRRMCPMALACVILLLQCGHVNSRSKISRNAWLCSAITDLITIMYLFYP